MASEKTCDGAEEMMWITGVGLRDNRCDANADTRVACPKPANRDSGVSGESDI